MNTNYRLPSKLLNRQILSRIRQNGSFQSNFNNGLFTKKTDLVLKNPPLFLTELNAGFIKYKKNFSETLSTKSFSPEILEMFRNCICLHLTRGKTISWTCHC